MRIAYTIEKSDISAIQSIYRQEKNCKFVKNRIKDLQNPKLSIEDLWYAICIGLFTSQQKSGPGSPINILLNKSSFPFEFKKLKKQKIHSAQFFTKIIQKYNGIRFSEKLGEFLFFNYSSIEDKYPLIEVELLKIDSVKSLKRSLLERNVCRQIQGYFKGIGPKQSRNLIQAMGFTKYEIPLDSRFVKWIKQNLNFDIPLSSNVLMDEEYYCFILNLFQNICGKAKILPAVVDACIFASFDKGKWDAV